MSVLLKKLDVFLHQLFKLAYEWEKWWLGLVFLLAAYVFYGEIHWVISDIPTHNSYLIEMFQGDLPWRPHILYYLLLGSLSRDITAFSP